MVGRNLPDAGNFVSLGLRSYHQFSYHFSLKKKVNCKKSTNSTNT